MEKSIQLCGRSVTYDFQRKKVKNINLRITADGSVHVSAGSRVPLREVEAFVRSRESRVIAALDGFAAAAKRTPRPENFEDGERLCLFGEIKTLRIVSGGRAVRCEGGELLLPAVAGDTREKRERRLRRWLRGQGIAAVTAACDRLYPIYRDCGIAYPELRFHSMRRRWGSCMPLSGVLTFNTALAAVPPDCIDYVVAHEFTHFLRADHSPEFYRRLSEVVPDWAEKRKMLSNYAGILG